MSEREDPGDCSLTAPTEALVQQTPEASRPVPTTATGVAPSLPPPRVTARRRLPFFANAAQPEIVRANQKDLYYLSQLTERFEDVARSLLGTRWLQNWSKELSDGSKIAYFGLTTLLGSQTLGEEYCDIMQYSVTTRKPPSPQRRAFMLSLHIMVPYIVSRIYSRLRRYLVARHEASQQIRASLNSGFVNHSPPSKAQSAPIRLVNWVASWAEDLPTFETLTEDYLRSVHLAIFYLWGTYYSLSKRASGIRFITTQARRSPESESSSSPNPPSSYEVLGVLMAVQLVVRTVLALRKRQATAAATLQREEHPSEKRTPKTRFTVDGQPVSSLVFDPDDPEQAAPYPVDEEGSDARDRRCTLCLGTRRDPTATECGHVFCWECVIGWAREKPECPLCRQSIRLSKLLPLHNL